MWTFTLALITLVPFAHQANVSTENNPSVHTQEVPSMHQIGFSQHDLQQTRSVSLTLRNGSLKSIPLKIPGYMNPNLSPKSNSGVTLEIGQEVFFTLKGKKRLLLTVTEELDGQKLMVDELIKKRVAEIEENKKKG